MYEIDDNGFRRLKKVLRKGTADHIVQTITQISDVERRTSGERCCESISKMLTWYSSQLVNVHCSIILRSIYIHSFYMLTYMLTYLSENS